MQKTKPLMDKRPRESKQKPTEKMGKKHEQIHLFIFTHTIP